MSGQLLNEGRVGRRLFTRVGLLAAGGRCDRGSNPVYVPGAGRETSLPAPFFCPSERHPSSTRLWRVSGDSARGLEHTAFHYVELPTRWTGVGSFGWNHRTEHGRGPPREMSEMENGQRTNGQAGGDGGGGSEKTSEMENGQRPNSGSPNNPGSRVSVGEDWPWWAQFFLALFAMALVALFLIGLPYVMTVAFEHSGNRGTTEAWTAMVPALLGLTTMTISGIFVFMTFRIDRGAKAEARAAAEEIAKESVKNIFTNPAESEEVRKWQEHLFKEMARQMANRIEKMDQRVEAQEKEFVEKMDQRIEKMDQRIEKMDQRIETQEKEFVEKMEKMDQRMEAQYDASNQRIAMRVSSIDDRLKERFDDADDRLKERFDDADGRIGARVEDAENRIEWRFDWLERNADE